jgi:predicted outer membrane repeat protein
MKQKMGGGVSLESNTKIVENFIQKYDIVIVFMSNSARNHGGALFIDDETTPDLCAAVISGNKSPTAECFTTASVSYAFSNNYASVSGSNLFGGLLDRCTVHGEHFQWNESRLGVSTFQKQSNINESDLDTVRSHPVLMCFCRDDLPDCDYRPEHIQVSRGKNFTLELTAYDQVRHTVNATIYSSLSSLTGDLGEGQVIQYINRACTELRFNFFTPIVESTNLTLSLEGPCNVEGISKATVRIDNICSCPIGFQIVGNNGAVCNCICDEVLWPYDKTQCNITTNSIIRKDNFWLTYINNTNDSSGYVIHPNCPFDYCHPPEKHISINLNLPHGSDAQCASNRSGILCGYCKPGLSVSLGSSLLTLSTLLAWTTSSNCNGCNPFWYRLSCPDVDS